MPYGHLIAATVMTLGVCQGHSTIASFFSILTSTSYGPSAIAELLVFNPILHYYYYYIIIIYYQDAVCLQQLLLQVSFLNHL